MTNRGVRLDWIGRAVAGVAFGMSAAVDPPAAMPSSTPQAAQPATASSTAEHPSSKAVDRLVKELRSHPAQPSKMAGQVGLYLIDAAGGPVTRIANEPEPGFNQCGSPVWSHDGRRIVFDATPGSPEKAEFNRSHLRMLELEGDRLVMKDLGTGNCPDFSPADDRIVFLSNAREPGAQLGVWLMQADGTGRRMLGDYGRPKWSPESRQFLIASFSTPTQVTIMDVRPENSGVLQVPDRQIFAVPNWAGAGTIVAAIGPVGGPADSIAMIDVTDPAQGKLKEVLWKRRRGPRCSAGIAGLLARHPALCLHRQRASQGPRPVHDRARQARQGRATGGGGLGSTT